MGWFMAGITETKETLVALLMLGKFVAERAKDGLNLGDAVALVEKFVLDDEFKATLEAGVKGLDAIPAELGDVDLQEALELVGLLIAALKK